MKPLALLSALLPAALLGVAGASAQGHQASEASGSLAPLDSLRVRVDSVRSANGVRAAQLAVVLPDTTVVWNFGEDRSGRPVTHATLFRVGSVSKLFAGLSAMVLAERGVLRLDRPLSELAPELPIRNPWRVKHPVLLSHLLEAGAGFVGFHPAHRDDPDVPDMNLSRFISELPYRLDVQWRPGAYTAYHNLGPVITAYLVEKVSRLPYASFVEETLFEPLSMTRSSFSLNEVVARHLADTTGYRRLGGMGPSGGLNSSAYELANVVRMLLGRGTYRDRGILSAESVVRFETSTSTLAAKRLGIAIGHGVNNWTTTYRGFRYQGHGGAIDARSEQGASYSAYIAYSPDQQTGFAYTGLIEQGADPYGSVYAIMGVVLAHLHPSPQFPLFSGIDQRDLVALAGCYERVNPRHLSESLGDIRLTVEHGVLRLIPDEGNPASWVLEPLHEPGLFRVAGDRPLRSGRPDDSIVAFVLDDDGARVMQHLDHPHEAFVHGDCPPP